MNHYFTSSGERVSQNVVENRVRKAKAEKLERQFEEFGYNFCEECGVNANYAGKLDCSHDISVKKAKEERKVELAWDVKVIIIRCRKCHQNKDKLNLQFI